VGWSEGAVGWIEKRVVVVVERVEEAVDGGLLGCVAHCRECCSLTSFLSPTPRALMVIHVL